MAEIKKTEEIPDSFMLRPSRMNRPAIMELLDYSEHVCSLALDYSTKKMKLRVGVIDVSVEEAKLLLPALCNGWILVFAVDPNNRSRLDCR